MSRRVALAQQFGSSGSPYPFFLANKPALGTSSLHVLDKYTNSVAYDVSLASKDQVLKALSDGHNAVEPMKKLPAFKRKEILLAAADEITKREEEIMYTLAVEAGKPLRDAKMEISRAIDTFTIAAEEAVRMYGEYTPLDISSRNAGLTSLTKRFPVGLVSMISPFNFPLNLVAHKVAPAIAVGCPFVLKPSDRTPRSALIVGEILSKVGAGILPEGAFSILPCNVSEAKFLSTDSRVKVLSFTGSERVGWDIHEQEGRRKVVLELGGTAPCIVDETANSESQLEHIAKRIAFGAFYYSGQSCISVQHIYAHESIYDALKEKLIVEACAFNMKKGDPMDDDTQLGPLISPEDAKRVENWVSDAAAKKAKILVGGRRDGSLFEATIIEDLAPESILSCEEVFAPVCAIEKYSDFNALIEKVNSSRFGLQAGVFTQNFNRAFYAYENLDFGGVVINDIPSIRVDSQPYGGVKSSGLGREGVRFAMQDFTEIKIMLMREAGKL